MMSNRWVKGMGVNALMGLLAVSAQTGPAKQLVVGFEDLETTVPPLEAYAGPGNGAYYNGSDGAGGFTSAGVTFWNNYNADWMSWIGWAYSTTTDVETAGFANQYSSFAGDASEGDVYAVTYVPSTVELPAGWRAPQSIMVSNTTYAALSMRDGDLFAKKFGDDPSTPDVVETDYPDYLILVITGLDPTGSATGSVTVSLADYRGGPEEDFILDDWAEVDLKPLYESGFYPGEIRGGIKTLEFSLESSDVGDFGINTPAFIAIDNLVLGATGAWGPYDLGLGPWIDTGTWLGWVYVEDPWVFVAGLQRWIYLPGDRVEPDGAWLYLPKTPGN